MPDEQQPKLTPAPSWYPGPEPKPIGWWWLVGVGLLAALVLMCIAGVILRWIYVMVFVGG